MIALPININLFNKLGFEIGHSNPAICHLEVICKLFCLDFRLLVYFWIEMTYVLLLGFFPMVCLFSVKVKLWLLQCTLLLFYDKFVLSQDG